MSTDDKTDFVVVQDRSSRRQFMRRGAAFAAVVGTVAATSGRSALASDCDRGGPGGKKPEHGGNGSDSDTGSGADPTGCGRQREEPPKISSAPPGSQPSKVRSVSVGKILG